MDALEMMAQKVMDALDTRHPNTGTKIGSIIAFLKMNATPLREKGITEPEQIADAYYTIVVCGPSGW